MLTSSFPCVGLTTREEGFGDYNRAPLLSFLFLFKYLLFFIERKPKMRAVSLRAQMFLAEWITRSSSRDSLLIEENIKAIWCHCEPGILGKWKTRRNGGRGMGASEMDKVKSVL